MHFSFFLSPIYLHKIPALELQVHFSIPSILTHDEKGEGEILPWESAGVKSGQRAGSQRSDFFLEFVDTSSFPIPLPPESWLFLTARKFLKRSNLRRQVFAERREPGRKM